MPPPWCALSSKPHNGDFPSDLKLLPPLHLDLERTRTTPCPPEPLGQILPQVLASTLQWGCSHPAGPIMQGPEPGFLPVSPLLLWVASLAHSSGACGLGIVTRQLQEGLLAWDLRWGLDVDSE